MKLKFKQQEFQTIAVQAICDLFAGQHKRTDTFTITNETQLQLEEGIGIRNVLDLNDEQITANMQRVQKRHSLPLTELGDRNAECGIKNENSELSFCVEMETGTGKTYVYTKTIFELHRQYGFTKFIVVVPSVAIREGVYKSFQITAEHFAAQYDNTPVRCFIYDSKRLSQVRLFATSSDIEIMIINIDAFKKAENIINQAQDRLSGETAMKYIGDTNPIVIIDEPQSVDNTPKAKEAIASLNPLAVFRYSATHKEKINLLYRLTPVDAYQMGLVKQICVSSNEIESDFNRPYIRCASVRNENAGRPGASFSAKVELDRETKDGKVERKTITIKQGADLHQLSGERDLYRGYKVVGIDCTPGSEGIEFDDGQFLYRGKAFGDIDENIIKRAQIRRTIESHLEKELRYTEKGIKVLSLFFIDEVAKYRTADGDQGIYAEMFEECYAQLMALPKFESLRDKFPAAIGGVHDGYFSQDKKGTLKNTKGDTAGDYDTYNTIMKDKEWLLSFDCPLRFIFSHSALKEGWDNPNVFQVCTLIEQKSTFTARQKVGRGLRLCVNQEGERIEDRNINVLHVMANESFAEFADNLQKEIEQETGVKFGVLQLSLFNGLTFTTAVTVIRKAEGGRRNDETGEVEPRITVVDEEKYTPEVIAVALETAKTLPIAENNSASQTPNSALVTVEQTVSYDDAKELITHFEQKGYVSKSGTIKDTMKEALAAGTLDIPAKFEAARAKFETVIARANTKPPVTNHANQVHVRLKKQVMISPEFLALWERIKGRTSYRVTVDEEALKARAIALLSEMERVPKARVVTKTAKVNVENSGVTVSGEYERSQELKDNANRLPNFIRAVDDACFLSRRTVVEILQKSGRSSDFINNPQKMTEMFIEVLRSVQGKMEIDGIRYQRLDGEEYFLQEIFDSEELIAFLDKNAVPVAHSLYDHIIYDSTTVEYPFAVALDDDPDVKMFFKIPDKFKIETPIGTYNPDWAVYMDKDGVERLYFVLETKGVSGFLGMDNLKTPERQKIRCGERHFAALKSGVVFSKSPVLDWHAFKKEL